jgi:hypothetical protein
VRHRPDDPHASGCRYDIAPVPTGVPYRVIAPDGTVLDGLGRHRHPVCAVVYRANGCWRLYSSHTTVEAAQKAIDGLALRDLAPTIVKIDR